MAASLFSKAKVVANMASEAFSRLMSGGPLIVEADRKGPRLTEIASKGVLAGMIALTALTAVAPAAAATLNLPAQAQAQAASYMADAARSLKAENSGSFWQNQIVDVVVSRKDDQYSSYRVASPGIDAPDALPFWGGPCTVTYAPAKDRFGDPGDYRDLDLPKGTDLTALYQMKGISECLLRSEIGTRGLVAHKKTFGDYDMIRDFNTLLAAAKYDRGTYEKVFALESASALNKLVNSSGLTSVASAIKLEGLQSLDTFLLEKDGFKRLGDDDVIKFPEYADAIVRHAHAAVARTGQDFSALKKGDLKAAAEALEGMGLKGAAQAARHAAGTGLVPSGKQIANWADAGTTSNGCAFIGGGSRKQQRREQNWCQSRFNSIDVLEVEDVTDKYGSDVAAYLNSRMPDLAPQASALKH